MRDNGAKAVAGGEFFRVSYMPDYSELFHVQKAARRYHYTSHQRRIWTLFFLVFAAAIAALGFCGNAIAKFVLAYAPREIATVFPVVLMVLIGLLFYWLICIKLNFKLSAKWLSERKAPLELTVSSDGDGLRLITAEAETFVRWHALERLFLTDKAVCFLYGAMTLYLPLRAFKSGAEAADFVNNALAHLSPQARQLSESDPSLAKQLSRIAASAA